MMETPFDCVSYTSFNSEFNSVAYHAAYAGISVKLSWKFKNMYNSEHSPIQTLYHVSRVYANSSHSCSDLTEKSPGIRA